METLIILIKKLLIGIGLPLWIVKYTDVIFYLLFCGFGAWLWKKGKKAVLRLKQRKLSKDLHPFFTPAEILNATIYYIPTKCQVTPPSEELEPHHTHSVADKEKLIPFFLKKGFKYKTHEQRFYIVLADSGMGKTTFMINLYKHYVSQMYEMPYCIKLLPLGSPLVDEELDKIGDEEKQKLILLLDAFDEDREAVADYKKRMDVILQKAYRCRKVIITSRTQFFPSEAEEPGETGILMFGGQKGYHRFRKLYVSPFDETDIESYLKKKFSIFQIGKRFKARQIVKHSPTLMVRPMLLSYIDDLLASNRKYIFTFQVYEELIERWIVREARRYRENRREDFKEELYKFSRAIAVDIYRNREMRGGLFIPGDTVKPFADLHHLQLEEIELKNRSLLNRNAQGKYKFSHKSILEYFLAKEVYNNSAFKKEFCFEGMEQAKLFYSEMSLTDTYEFLVQPDLLGKYRTKYSHSSKWLDLSKIGLYEMKTLTHLRLENNHISDITPLRRLGTLIALCIHQNEIANITPLTQLTALEELYLHQNQISDITPLKRLTALTELRLESNRISDINPLKQLTSLNTLDLKSNQISDITPLRQLTAINQLYLDGNQISDISSLTQLKTLNRLYLDNNQISDITPLSRLTEINELFLQQNQISDITPLILLKKLSRLYLDNNQISDITPLSRLTEINELFLQQNQISDITPLAQLTVLRRLYLDSNQISDITPLAQMTVLKRLYLDNNQISDITPLNQLTALNVLGLSSNQISDISPLMQLENLLELWIVDNPIPKEQLDILKQALPNCKIEHD